MTHSVEAKSSSCCWHLNVNPDDLVALSRFEFRDGTLGNYIRLLVATNPHTPPAVISMALAQAGCPDSIRCFLSRDNPGTCWNRAVLPTSAMVIPTDWADADRALPVMTGEERTAVEFG